MPVVCRRVGCDVRLYRGLRLTAPSHPLEMRLSLHATLMSRLCGVRVTIRKAMRGTIVLYRLSGCSMYPSIMTENKVHANFWAATDSIFIYHVMHICPW